MTMPAFDKDQRRVLHELRKAGALSRTALADRLEMSNTALTRVSRELLTLGFIEELAQSDAQGRGRPVVPLQLASRGGYAVGATAHEGLLDIAIVDFAGTLIATHRESVAPMDPRAFARRVRTLTHRLVDRHGLLGRRMLGIGVAVPGPARSPDGQRWHVVEEMPGWRDAPLRDILSAELGWPLWIENDANVAAVAEFYIGGLLKEFSTIAVILLGYGIGAGVIADGRLVRGQYGIAGEIGALFPGGRPRPSPLDLLSNLRAQGCALSSVGDIDPADAAQRGVIENWMDRAARQLQVVTETAFVWLDPGAIVLAGAVPRAVLNGLATRLGAASSSATVDGRGPPLRVSDLPGSPVTLGAALLPIHAIAAEG